MAAKTIFLTFDGYWREQNIGGAPKQAGIYCVYECSYNPFLNTVTLVRIIYIGKAEDVSARILGHEKWGEWRKHCGAGSQLCFSFAPVQEPDRQRAEAALIFQHKPPVNVEYKLNFPFDETAMMLAGKTHLLKPYFTVKNTDLANVLAALFSAKGRSAL